MNAAERRRWRGCLLNGALGAWLVVSVFAWEHTRAELWYSCLLGGAVVVASVLAWMWRPRLRWTNVAAAVALFLLTVLSPHVEKGLVLNHLFVSLGLLAFALLPLMPSSEPVRSWSVPPTPDA